jgi:tRNA (guanine37-N1)-methyltransferase
MRLDVITLFEELFKPFMSLGVNRRAFELGRIDLEVLESKRLRSRRLQACG